MPIWTYIRNNLEQELGDSSRDQVGALERKRKKYHACEAHSKGQLKLTSHSSNFN